MNIYKALFIRLIINQVSILSYHLIIPYIMLDYGCMLPHKEYCIIFGLWILSFFLSYKTSKLLLIYYNIYV